jgi:MFS family permease
MVPVLVRSLNSDLCCGTSVDTWNDRSNFMLSLADPSSYYQLLLAQGFGVGIGAGLLYMPALAIQARHWQKHRALAMGLASTGVLFSNHHEYRVEG